MKICTRCKQEKPRDNFYKRKDGISAKCKICTCEDHKKARAEVRVPEENETLLLQNLRKCSCCEEIKLTTEFYRKRESFEGYCKECKNSKNSIRRQDPKVRERENEVRKARIEARPALREEMAEYCRAYYQANKSRHNVWVNNWRRNNPEKASAIFSNWRKRNRDLMSYHSNKRRAAKLRATPKWSEQEDEQIRMIYKQSKQLSESLGIKHHVDHIVPLQSDFVCGLHCLANLQVITAFENISKNNTYWPDMW